MARGSLAPGSTVEELARFFPFSLFPRPCLYPALHRSQNPGVPRPILRVQELDRAGSGFPRALLSLSGSPPPPSRRLVPRAMTAREPDSPSTERALGHGGSASPPGEGCRGNPGRIMDTRLAIAKGSGPYSLNLPRRCRRLPLRTLALKLTGQADAGGRRASGGRFEALESRPPRPGRGPSHPRSYRNNRDLWHPSPLKVIIRQIRKFSPQISRRANRRHFTGFPHSSRRGEAGAQSRREEAAPAPAPSAGRRLPHSRVQRRGLPGSPASGRAVTPRPRLPPGNGNWRGSVSLANAPVLSPLTRSPSPKVCRWPSWTPVMRPTHCSRHPAPCLGR